MSAEVYPIRPPVPIEETDHADVYGAFEQAREQEQKAEPVQAETDDRPQKWFKVHNEDMRSFRFRNLHPSVRATLFDLWTYATSEGSGGKIPDHKALKQIFNISTRDAERHYTVLMDAGFIEYDRGYVLIGWNESQGKRDCSTARTAKFKANDLPLRFSSTGI